MYEAEKVEGSQPNLVAIIKVRVEQVTLVAKEEEAWPMIDYSSLGCP